MLKSAIAIFLMIIASFAGMGQTQSVSFSLFAGSRDLPLGKINSMTRDAQGVMWFADKTNQCVAKYDGSNITRYIHDPRNPNSLGGDYPETIVADSTGIIWISFYGGTGIDRLDPASGNFTHYRHSSGNSASLGNDTVSCLLFDHLGNFWVGTNGGIDLMDQQTGTFKHYSHHNNDITSLSCDKVRSIYEDHQGTVWVGTGLVWDSAITVGGLNRFDRKTGTFTRFMNDPKDPTSLIDNRVRAIFEDSRGNFWIGTAGDGLHSMDRKSGKFERHPHNASHPEFISRPALKGHYDHITFITEDKQGQLWIGTFSNGLVRYDPVLKKTTHFGGDGDKSSGFKDAGPWTAFSSNDGMLWIATEQEKLYTVNTYTNNVPFHPLNHAGVNRFYEESAAILWIATDSGLVREDRITGARKIYKNDPRDPNSISDNVVRHIIKSHDGKFWIGTANGLNRLDPTTGIFTRFMHDPTNKQSFNGDPIISLYEDSDNNLWIGTFSMGLDKLTSVSGKFSHFQHIDNDTNSLGNNLVPGILNDESGDLWISAWNNGGLNRLNPTTGKIRHYLPLRTTAAILKDRNGVIWVQGSEDIYKYDRSSDRFTNMSQENAVLKGMHDIKSFVLDDKNNLWISEWTGSSIGLYKINPERNQAIFFGKEIGIPTEYVNYQSSIKTTDGHLLFGASTGYYFLNPDSMTASPYLPIVTITGFWLGNEEIRPGKGKLLTNPISRTEKIDLSYKQNVFSFGFDIVDFGLSENRVVQYKLENYDKEWRQPGTENKVYYFNMPPGDYIFRIKAINKTNGVWVEKKIGISISPPWWNTWWAWVLFILTGLAILRFYILFRSRKLRRENQVLEEKVVLRTQQLQKSMDSLKATQSQLVQSEKMASLGELTAGIAHEIQNPLNFVNNFSEVNNELIDELETERRKIPVERNEALENELIDNIKQNLGKINHHGKRADSIVKGMLQHSRMGSGGKEATDINSLCDEYLRLSYHGIRAKDKNFNATLNTDFDPAIGSINIVPQDIGRVLLNLYNNAFYAVQEKSLSFRRKLSEGGPLQNHPVEVGIVQDSQNEVKTTNEYKPIVSVRTKKIADKIIIQVEDNGNGIPAKDLDKIFQPFFTTKPTGQGTGLGLSLSYDIVKAHGGELKVETEANQYTTFIIKLAGNQ